MAYNPKYYMDMTPKLFWTCSCVLVYIRSVGVASFSQWVELRSDIIIIYLRFSLNMRYSKTIGPILTKFTAFTTAI